MKEKRYLCDLYHDEKIRKRASIGIFLISFIIVLLSCHFIWSSKLFELEGGEYPEYEYLEEVSAKVINKEIDRKEIPKDIKYVIIGENGNEEITYQLLDENKTKELGCPIELTVRLSEGFEVSKQQNWPSIEKYREVENGCKEAMIVVTEIFIFVVSGIVQLTIWKIALSISRKHKKKENTIS